MDDIYTCAFLTISEFVGQITMPMNKDSKHTVGFISGDGLVEL